MYILCVASVSGSFTSMSYAIDESTSTIISRSLVTISISATVFLFSLLQHMQIIGFFLCVCLAKRYNYSKLIYLHIFRELCHKDFSSLQFVLRSGEILTM